VQACPNASCSMTYSVKTVVGVVNAEKREGFLGTRKPFFGGSWVDVKVWGCWVLNDIWTYAVGAHMGHLLEFFVALACWCLFFADGRWVTECAEFRAGWMAKVLAFNLTCEVVFVGFWHWLLYVSSFVKRMAPFKFNPTNQYERDGQRVGFVMSSSGQLQREVTFTTLGWLQSGLWQCFAMWFWASGHGSVYTDFWKYPAYSCGYLFLITYWREIHFYWCHRGMHPWWDRKLGLVDGDIGAFLYRHAHSLHHKSYNPGPWSGLCMHPIEHFLYYSCAWLLLLVSTVHPLHFLYAKFHADIAPIGGHDGYEEPAGNGDFHWLHHAKFECNYGVPFPIDFDKMFGTWVDYKEYKAAGNKMPAMIAAKISDRCGDHKVKAH